jgi:hypothetical protein
MSNEKLTFEDGSVCEGYIPRPLGLGKQFKENRNQKEE